MTDKIQKIKDWISKTQDGLMDANGNFENPSNEGAFHILSNLDYYIDSLQEEPVSIWHEASKKYPLAGKEIIVLRDDKIYYGKYIGGFHRYVRAEIQLTDDTAQTYAIIDYLTKKDKWIYVENLLNLSNVEKTTKNWKEPVSEDLEEAASWYAKKEYDRKNPATLPDRCKGCYAPLMYAFKAGAKWQKAKDESTTEDLGDYINKLSKQFPEVSFAKLSRIAVRVAKWQAEQFEKDYTDLCNGIATAKGIAVAMAYDKGVADTKVQMMKNIWKPADGDDLPEIDREVIVLIKYNTQRNIHDKEYSTYKVGFGHRPNPDGWDGKNIDTNEVTHYTPKLYDKGGWNAPDIVYWLDIELPKEIEL